MVVGICRYAQNNLKLRTSWPPVNCPVFSGDLRVAHSVMFVIKTKQNAWWWLIKCITCTIKEIKSQISFLPNHFATDDFAHLKYKIFIRDISDGPWTLTWRRLADPFPPKYQNSPRKVAPQPKATAVFSPNSNSISWVSPAKFMTTGLFGPSYVLKTRAAFCSGGRVVGGIVVGGLHS